MDGQYILRQDKYNDSYLLPIDLETEFLEWAKTGNPNARHETFAKYFVDLNKLIIYCWDNTIS